MAHRKAFSGHRQPDHDLRCIAAAVLRMPALARRGVALAPGRATTVHHVIGAGAHILFVDLEVQRGGVVQNSDILPVDMMAG